MASDLDKTKKKVIVGVSGGVDSSVTLFLLKKRGYLPIGVFMKFSKLSSSKKAEEVCNFLKVPFHIIDVQEEFKKKVISAFLDDYEKGVTPNPCVVCNREVKFKTLFENLSKFNGHYVATGHYVRIEKKENADFEILKGVDSKKDQSYFLWDIKKEWLGQIIFPLGHFEKKDVRKIAIENNLPIVEQKDSQEVCFIDGDISSFLSKHLKSIPGNIVDRDRTLIGQHKGLFNYTIGQRKRIGLSGGPYYVLSKNNKKNELVVTKNKKDLLFKELFFRDANFFKKVSFPFEAEVKIRYNTNQVEGVVYEDKVIFKSPQKSITSGQSVVFYKKDKLLGGGVIL
ncbi:MAG: tRNA 2-thiouridine(34) synthase MnmA [Patescibacteria group bacterium]|nr:tRNA 2-thiouridine(34) synthase MnmA [Patescibacteria group bacterium]